MIFPDDLYEPERYACDPCGRATSDPVMCADDNRLHCEDCADECRVCLADQDEQRRVDAARKGE